MSASADTSSIVRAREGDLDAFAVLVHQHAGTAYRIARRIVRTHEDAEDVTQEALLAAWRALPSFRGDAELGTWLHTIVRRRALNHVSRNKHLHVVPLIEDLDECIDPAPSPDQRAVDTATMQAMTMAISQLPVVQRTIIRLHHLQEQSYQQVATRTCSTVPAVRSHLHRGRRTLARELRGWADTA